MHRDELTTYLDDYLHLHSTPDYGQQGLQIEGREDITHIVGTVDAALPCAQFAVQRDADLLLVHHGIFWGDAQPLTGGYGHLVRTYLEAGLNLYAAHLALDGHREVGNNVELARRLGVEIDRDASDRFARAKGTPIGVIADAPTGTTLDDMVGRFEQNIGTPKLVQAHGPRRVSRIGIVSGSGIGFLHEAAALGCDTLLTGETSHANFYDALNTRMNVIYGGHYATETVGVQALGRHLAQQFDLSFEFVDLPTNL